MRRIARKFFRKINPINSSFPPDIINYNICHNKECLLHFLNTKYNGCIVIAFQKMQYLVVILGIISLPFLSVNEKNNLQMFYIYFICAKPLVTKHQLGVKVWCQSGEQVGRLLVDMLVYWYTGVLKCPLSSSLFVFRQATGHNFYRNGTKFGHMYF